LRINHDIDSDARAMPSLSVQGGTMQYLKRVAKPKRDSRYARRVISICFDEQSLSRMQPGLKLVFAHEEPPIFIDISEEKKARTTF